jgi:hypothetical protein
MAASVARGRLPGTSSPSSALPLMVVAVMRPLTFRGLFQPLAKSAETARALATCVLTDGLPPEVTTLGISYSFSRFFIFFFFLSDFKIDE